MLLLNTCQRVQRRPDDMTQVFVVPRQPTWSGGGGGGRGRSSGRARALHATVNVLHIEQASQLAFQPEEYYCYLSQLDLRWSSEMFRMGISSLVFELRYLELET